MLFCPLDVIVFELRLIFFVSLAPMSTLNIPSAVTWLLLSVGFHVLMSVIPRSPSPLSVILLFSRVHVSVGSSWVSVFPVVFVFPKRSIPVAPESWVVGEYAFPVMNSCDNGSGIPLPLSCMSFPVMVVVPYLLVCW